MKKIKFICMGVLCLLLSSNAFAENLEGSKRLKTDANIFGHVVEEDGNEHLAGATLRIKGTNIYTVTDASGHYKLTNLPLGKQTIIASLIGFKEQAIEVNLVKGKTIEVDFDMVEDLLELSQIVVTGTRTKHFIKDVPIRTEVVTSQLIENKNAQNLYETLEGVPGIRVEQQCQFCNFSVIRMQGLGAEHTQVLVDGNPIYSGLASIYGLQQMGTNDIDRMEIVKGAGSALYGSSAVAGAINIISKEPTFEPDANFEAQIGSYGYRNFKGSGSIRKNNLGVLVTAQRTEAGAIDETQDGMSRDEVNHKDGITDRVYSLTNDLGLNLFIYSPFAAHDKLVLRAKAIDELRYGGDMTNNIYINPYTEGTENIRTKRISPTLTYNLPIGESSELNFATAYVHHKRTATNDAFYGSYQDVHGEAPSINDMRPYIATENVLTPSLTFTSKLGNHTFIVGAQAYINRLDETGQYCVDDESSAYKGTVYSSLGKKEANEWGVFVQDEWNITPKFVVVPGIRVDGHSSNEKYSSSEKVFDANFPETEFNHTSFNPRLAMKYEISDHFTVRANIGTGYRAPYGFSEDLHLCSGSPRVWKSSDLDGERSISYNLSADYYGHHVQVSANVFRTDLKDKIQFTDATDAVRKLGYTYQWENIDDAYVQGIELGVKWNPFKNFKTGLNMTFNQGKFDNVREDWKGHADEEKSKNISRFPAMTGDLNLEYTPGTWTFSLIGSLQGKMYIDYFENEEGPTRIKETDPFTLWNLKASKRFGAFTVFAGGKNIFSYIQDEKHTDDAAFMYAPMFGATWYAGLRINL